MDKAIEAVIAEYDKWLAEPGGITENIFDAFMEACDWERDADEYRTLGCWLLEQLAEARAKLEKLPSAFRIECARDELDRTKGGTGSGTIACSLWNAMNSIVLELEAAEAATTGEKE